MNRVKALGLVAMFALAAVASAQSTGVVKEITIRGNKRISNEAILAYMKTRIGSPLNNAQLDDDRANITAELGFFSRVSITPSLRSDDSWQIIVDVAEYEEIKEIQIIGNAAVSTEEVRKAIETVVVLGQPFNRKDAQRIATTIKDLYRRKQQLSELSQAGPSNLSPNTLVVEIVEPKVGVVTVEGQTHTKPRVFDRLIRMRPGDPFRQAAIAADFQRLRNTQWFTQTEPIQSGTPQVTDLTWKVQEQRTAIFNTGVTLDPQNQLAGFVALSDNNFRGSGQAIGVNLLQGTQGAGASATLDYTNPFYDAKDSTLRMSVYDRVNFRFQNTLVGGNQNFGNLNRYFERRTGGTLAFSRPFREDFRDLYSLGFSLRSERIKTTANIVDPTQPLPDNLVQQDGEIGAIAFTGVLNTRDLDLDPSRGTFFRLDQEFGYAIIEPSATSVVQGPTGRSNFIRTTFDYRTYFSRDKTRMRPQDPNPTVFALRLRGGTISGQVPFFEQYFAGGNESIRGYNEDRFWGTNLFVTSFEYRRPIDRFSDNGFSVVAFVDLGSAWGGYPGLNGIEQNSRFNLAVGYGIGIRLRTPLGPIRLDFGFTGDGQARPHFGIGPSF